MATLVCFHAHPDDEAIATGGTMAKAKRDGHTVVLVLATRGEQGEPVEGVLNDGELLGDRRSVETQRSADILGVDRVEFLGYEDSGMIGEPANDNERCFWQADVEQAAARLAAILDDVDADILTIYDPHGGYGHPDHIMVHRAGRRAAEMSGIDRVFWSTMNRTRFQQQMAENPDVAAEIGEDREQRLEEDEFGLPETEITHAIDVMEFIDQKRESMAAHASQIDDDSFFLKMPPDIFAGAFGTEWFVAQGTTRSGDFGADLFAEIS